MPTETKGERIAGAYAYRQMYDFVADINADVSPFAPSQIGGDLYIAFFQAISSIDDLIVGSMDDRESLSLQAASKVRIKARESIKSITHDFNERSDLDEYQREYLKRFNLACTIISQLERGCSVESIMASGLN